MKAVLIMEVKSALYVKSIDVLGGHIELTGQMDRAVFYRVQDRIVDRAVCAANAAFPGLIFAAVGRGDV